MSDSKTASVKLRGKDIMLTLPGYADRWDIYMALEHASTAPSRIPTAALGMCWVGPHKPPVSYAGCSHDVGTFGGAIWNHLLEEGCTPMEIVTAGNTCLRLLCQNLLPQEVIEKEEAGFRGESSEGGDR